MEKNTVMNLSGFHIKPGEEHEFFKWYDEVHIPMLLKFPGLKKVSRGEIAKGDDKYPFFLTVFEFEDSQAFDRYVKSPELAEAHQDATERSALKNDREGMWRVQYKITRTWNK